MIDLSIGSWTLQADVVVLMRIRRNKLLVQWLPAAGTIAINEDEGARRVRRRVAYRLSDSLTVSIDALDWA